MKRIACLLALFISISLFAGERVTIWPKDKMPHRQNHQIAAMTDESGEKDFNADKNEVVLFEKEDN